MTCECFDPGCPNHEGISECTKRAVIKVRRIDMEDGNTTFRMCRKCADDALASGVFDTDVELTSDETKH